jgi:mRNA interferase RelE/StbE
LPRYEVEWGPAARRALNHLLPEKIATAVVEYVTHRLSENPQRLGKKLSREYGGFYSARISDYRIIYEIQNQKIVILVADVRHRSVAYAAHGKQFKKPRQGSTPNET